MEINELRTLTNRALAKVIAYKQCGKPDEERRWTLVLMRLLSDDCPEEGAGHEN